MAKNYRFSIYLTFGLVIFQFGYTNSNDISDKENFKENSVLRDSQNNNNKNNNKNNNSNINNIDNNNSNNIDNTNILNNIKNNYSDNRNQHFDEPILVVADDDSYSSESLSLSDQVRLLSKQLNALTMRRREDYKLLENSLKKSIKKCSDTENNDTDIRSELQQLRDEVKKLRETGKSNKERLTVEWLSQSIAEIRKQLTELQEMASNASKDLSRRSQVFEDITTITNDFDTIKLELEALKHRQEKTEVFVRELREEAVQKEEDLRRILRIHDETKSEKISNIDSVELDADHRMRHHRFLRQQIHDLEVSQRSLKRQLNELQFYKISDRVRSLEIEQHRIANINFNLSRQIAGLDKLHGSMLELLEDVEGIQSKVEKNIPDIRREISKLEFTSAQLNSEQSVIREEEHNSAKSIQAMAVSVSALQNERDNVKKIDKKVQDLEKTIEHIQSTANVHKSILHRRIEKMEAEAQHENQTTDAENNNIETANNLVEQLESVELQYESIINKLPSDCSQVDHKSSGLYLIAPVGQHRPTLASCTAGGWTIIQRRYDGSVDFNRSWEMYAQGFGSPSGEFWIGNDVLHHLTADNCTKLKIIMQDIYDNTWHAIYEEFYVSERSDGYRLHISSYSGNASDALDYQNRMQFSAIDVDRDISNTHCAANYEGGWWFSHCQHANLNGRYNLGLTWFDAARNEWIAVKSSQMMVTKRDNCSAKLTTDETTTTIATVV